MISSTLLLFLGTALQCLGQEIVLEGEQIFSPYEKFGLNVTSNLYGMPEMLKSNVKTPIINDLGYFGPVYFSGQQREYGRVLYDIASSWFAVTSSECDSTCSSPLYNMSKGAGQIIGTDFSLNYISVFLKGQSIQDQVCLYYDPRLGSPCVNNTNFMGITNQKGLKNDGILGLSTISSDKGSSIVANLKNLGFIDNMMLSFLLKYDSTYEGYFTLGGYNEIFIKSNYSVVWNSLISTDQGKFNDWQVEIRDLFFQGDSVFSNTYSVALLDFTTTFTVIPLQEMISIANVLTEKFGKEDFVCNLRDQMICRFIKTACSKIVPQLDSIKFQLNEKFDFNVPPFDYLINQKFDQTGDCYLGFQGVDAGKFILGYTFLRPFMQVYDSENKRIGLVPTRFAGGSITEHIYPKKNLLIAIIAISAVLVLIVNIVVVFKIIKLRNAKEDPIQNDYGTEESFVQGKAN